MVSTTRAHRGFRTVAVTPATADEWDAAWARSPHATLFESRAFAELWSLYTKGDCKPAAQRVSFADGRVVVVPLSRQSAMHGLASITVAGPAGNYGGSLALHGRLSTTHAAALRRWLLGTHQSLIWRANPYDHPTLAAFPRWAEIDFTSALLLDGDIDRVSGRWSRNHRSAVKKARELGVTVRLADRVEDWRSYYHLYEQSLARWGSATTFHYGLRLFELLAEMPNSQVRLWIASANGSDLSGVVCVVSRNSIIAWHAASINEGFEHRAVQATFHAAICDAIDHGATWFDLNPSSSLSGVERFKSGWGALPLPCPVVRRLTGPLGWSYLGHRAARALMAIRSDRSER